MKKLSTLLVLGMLFFTQYAVGQTYCASYYPTSFFEYITKVEFKTISNTSGNSGYSDFTGLVADVRQDQSYNLDVTIVNLLQSNDYVMAWFDWNHDFDFADPGEAYFLGSTTSMFVTLSMNIAVPVNAALGATRMRISINRGFQPGPCIAPNQLWGETEDYTLNINLPPLRWDGEADTEWLNPLNWVGDVLPTYTDDVLIPGGLTQYPDFNGPLYVGAPFGTQTCQSLEIANGASVTLTGYGQLAIFQKSVTVNTGGLLDINVLTVGTGGKLFITGGTVDVSNTTQFLDNSSGNMSNGSLVVAGVISFSQLSNWQATGGTLVCKELQSTQITNYSATVTLYNFRVNSGGTAVLTGASTQPMFLNGSFELRPNARFTLENTGNVSTIFVGQNVTLDGNATGKSSFVDRGGTVAVFGNTTVRSYYTDGRWHFISSPVSNAVSNVFFDIYLRDFDEPTNTYGPYVTSITEPLTIGKGFEIWSTISNPIVNYTGGYLNTGNVSPALTATDSDAIGGIDENEGFNLIGNPYPSAFDVGTENDPVAGFTWTNLDQTIYAWNGANWSTFNRAGDGASVNGGSRYVPTMQGFFVKANNFNPVLTIPNGSRLHSSQANYKASAMDKNEIRLAVSGNGYSDEMVVRSIAEATIGVDSEYDAYKLSGIEEAPQISSVSGMANLSINTLPEYKAGLIIPVHFTVGSSAIYTVDIAEVDLTDLNLNVYLEDVKEGVLLPLDETSEYVVSAKKGDDAHRFNLIFKDAETDEFDGTGIAQIFSFENLVYVKKESGVVADVFIYDVMGREVARVLNNSNSDLQIKVSAGTGNYIVKLISGNTIETKKVFIY